MKLVVVGKEQWLVCKVGMGVKGRKRNAVHREGEVVGVGGVGLQHLRKQRKQNKCLDKC